jgi:tetratricopeptide (TPR) repeat protein
VRYDRVVSAPSRSVAFALVLGLSRAVVAAPVDIPEEWPVKARQQYKVGLREYALQNFKAAIVAFENAYRVSDEPTILFSLGQAQRLNHECEKALRSYYAFLRSEPEPAKAKSADAAIELCKKQITEMQPPPSAVPEVAAPPPVVIVAAPPPPPRRWYQDPAGDVLGGAGVVVGVVGLGLMGHALAVQSDANNSYGDLQRAHDVDSQRVAGIAMAAVGGGLLVTAVIRWAWIAKHPVRR